MIKLFENNVKNKFLKCINILKLNWEKNKKLYKGIKRKNFLNEEFIKK